MKTLAARHSISDVGLAKACRRAEIPVPERGYWAKRQAGKRVLQQPLPPRGPGMPDEVEIGGGTSWPYNVSTNDLLSKPIPQAPTFPESIADLAARVRAMVGKVGVPKTIAKPHRLIARLIEADEHRREKQRTSHYAFSWDAPLFDSPFERRRLRVLNAIFTALERAGAKPSVRGNEARELGVHVGHQHVSFTLDRPGQGKNPSRGRPSKGDTAPDALQLVIASWRASDGTRNAWNDSEVATVEDQAQDIVVDLIVAGEAQHREASHYQREWMIERKVELEKEARRKKEEAERRERERRLKLEKERVERLLGEARALRQARDIRAYVEEVRAAITVVNEPMSKSDLEAWATWALAQADHIDPILSGRFREPYVCDDEKASEPA